MSSETRTQRLSILSLAPLMLSGCAWVCVVFALATVPFLGEGLAIPHLVGIVFLTLGMGASLGSLAAGGLSLIRLQLYPQEMWGSRFAAVGCLSVLPALLITSAPVVSLLAIIIFFVSMMWGDAPPDFIW